MKDHKSCPSSSNSIVSRPPKQNNFVFLPGVATPAINTTFGHIFNFTTFCTTEQRKKTWRFRDFRSLRLRLPLLSDWRRKRRHRPLKSAAFLNHDLEPAMMSLCLGKPLGNSSRSETRSPDRRKIEKLCIFLRLKGTLKISYILLMVVKSFVFI